MTLTPMPACDGQVHFIQIGRTFSSKTVSSNDTFIPKRFHPKRFHPKTLFPQIPSKSDHPLPWTSLPWTPLPMDTPLPWTPLTEPPKISRFFPSPRPIFALFFSLGRYSRGIVATGRGHDHPNCTFGLFCETPAACRAPGLAQNDPRPKRTNWVVHGRDPWPQFHENPPREKTRSNIGGRGKRTRKFRLPSILRRGPTLRGLPFGAPLLRGPQNWGSPLFGPRNWTTLSLDEIVCG